MRARPKSQITKKKQQQTVIGPRQTVRKLNKHKGNLWKKIIFLRVCDYLFSLKLTRLTLLVAASCCSNYNFVIIIHTYFFYYTYFFWYLHLIYFILLASCCTNDKFIIIIIIITIGIFLKNWHLIYLSLLAAASCCTNYINHDIYHNNYHDKRRYYEIVLCLFSVTIHYRIR